MLFIAVSALSTGAAAQNTRKETPLPTLTDLRAAARAAQQQGQPLVVLLSLPGCPWCELLRRNYLAPMRSEGLHAYQWQVHDRSVRILDFQGQMSHGEKLSQAYRYTTTPTVLFLNAQGVEIAPRIEGVASVDFLGAVLEERLTLARERIKADK